VVDVLTVRVKILKNQRQCQCSKLAQVALMGEKQYVS
jgi:hypothetical protein